MGELRDVKLVIVTGTDDLAAYQHSWSSSRGKVKTAPIFIKRIVLFGVNSECTRGQNSATLDIIMLAMYFMITQMKATS